LSKVNELEPLAVSSFLAFVLFVVVVPLVVTDDWSPTALRIHPSVVLGAGD
jgi:hypothetical protein